MRPILLIISSLLILLVVFPFSAQAFWGTEQGNHLPLNFESGYDVNTVTTVTGQILSVQAGADRHNLQLEIEGGGTSMIICLGPQRYWVEQGMPLKEGDKVAVRGSKAQGQDGVIYILAQKITEIDQGVAVVLRDECGHPNWAGGVGGSGRGRSGGGRGGGSGRGERGGGR